MKRLLHPLKIVTVVCSLPSSIMAGVVGFKRKGISSCFGEIISAKGSLRFSAVRIFKLFLAKATSKFQIETTCSHFRFGIYLFTIHFDVPAMTLRKKTKTKKQ